jgi:hypothetical protein
MHLSTAELRAYLDRALPAAEQTAAAEHLAACAVCAAELRSLEARAARVQARLAVLAPAPAEAARRAQAVLNLVQERERKDRVPMFKSLAKRRSLWITAAAVLVLAVSFSFAPVRTFAGQFLGLFRVKQIAVLPVDLARLASLHDDPTLSDQITRMFNESVTVTKDPGPTVAAASAAEAGQLAGFAVRELGGAIGAPQFTVTDSAGFKVVIDQPRAQAILNDAGRADLQLPASLDGATVEVSIPAGVAVAYNCPDMSDAAETTYGPGEMRGDVDELVECVLLGQMPSPSVETPPNLDMARLAELGLQFTGMSPDEARAFSGSVDWTSTLVVPIPMNASTAQQVSVDGVTGTLVTRRGDDGVPPRYTLMWVKNGIVYVLSAFGTAQDAVALGNTIR